MKRSLFSKTLKPAFLAIPAAALMLGAAQAGTTVGLNFQAWYYDSGQNPQTIGFNNGYSDYATTGLPVTTTAFGVTLANWNNTDPLGPNTSISQSCTFGETSTNFSGGLACYVNAPEGTYFSGAGELQSLAEQYNYPPYSPGLWVVPGNNEVFWGEIFGNATNQFSVSVSGLAAKFPHGYVIQSMSALGANSGQTFPSLPNVNFTDGTITNTEKYNIWYVQNNTNAQWTVSTVGISDPSIVFTADTIYVNSGSDATNESASLAGFILTDQPVVSQDPTGITNYTGAAIALSAGAVGIPPLSYQWQLNGIPIPGATSTSYSKANTTLADAGSYMLVVTNLYGSTTSGVATVAVSQSQPLMVTDLPSVTNNFNADFSELLSVSVTGSLPLSYQWQMNGMPISGATNASFTVSNLTTGLSAYSVSIMNSFGTIQSQTNYANVTALPAALINAYTPQVGLDAPIAYWPLNESSGAIAYDYSSFTNNGAITGSMTLGAAGPQPPAFAGFNTGNTAYQFDGSTSYVNCNTNASLSGMTDFTVETWVKTTSTAGGSLVVQSGPNTYNGEYYCQMNANGTLEFGIFGFVAPGYQFDFNSVKSVNDGNWHHLAFVRSGTNGIIYIDGMSNATASGPEMNLSSALQTCIGVFGLGSYSSYFNGTLASVAIYNYALSPGRILAHSVAGGIAPSVSLVPGIVGDLVLDSKPTGTPYNGVGRGTTWLASSTSPFDGSSRNGVEQFVETNNSQITIPANTNLAGTTGTISFWMMYNYPGAFPGPGAGAAMLYDNRSMTSSLGTVIYLTGGGDISVQAFYGPNFTGSIDVADGVWHHVAVTYDQSANGATTLYIDGQVDNSQVTTNAWSWAVNLPIELGRSRDPYWNIYDGQMDDFRIYNQVLSPADINSIDSGESSGLVQPGALMLRYNFDAANAPIAGNFVTFPRGTLQSSPALGAGAVWTTVTNAVSPLVLTPDPTVPAMFYRSVLGQ